MQWDDKCNSCGKVALQSEVTAVFDKHRGDDTMYWPGQYRLKGEVWRQSLYGGNLTRLKGGASDCGGHCGVMP
jgi:hypothetical protein